MTDSLDLYFGKNQIRALTDNNQIWFCAKDVCAALGIGWAGTSLQSIPKDWQGMWFHHTPRGKQRMKFISEPALYKLAFRSNKAEADAFTNWVASEVLPQIRQTGGYQSKALPKPERISQSRDIIMRLREMQIELKDIEEDMMPLFEDDLLQVARRVPEAMQHYVTDMDRSVNQALNAAFFGMRCAESLVQNRLATIL